MWVAPRSGGDAGADLSVAGVCWSAAAPAGLRGRPWLMLVTDRRLAASMDLITLVAQAVAGGVDLVQVREKDLPDAELLRLTRAILEAAGGRAGVVVNGRPEVARQAGAGLHLPEAAPLPPDPPPLWGRSVHSPAQAALAVRARPAYLVAGPVFPTDSKPGARPLGPEGLQAIVRAAAGIPVLAIGGLEPPRVASVLGVGAAGVAVRGAILKASDPRGAARKLRVALDAAARSLAPAASPSSAPLKESQPPADAPRRR